MPQLTLDVEVRERMYDRSMSLGANRQAMIEEAAGEYVSFVDDDDLVAEDYVSSILPLLDGVDYIGFQLQLYMDGIERGATFHSLQHNGWYENGGSFYRDFSHLNPIRRELALQAPFEGSGGEDTRWADRIRGLQIVKTEHYVPKIMYHYYFRTCKSD